MKNILLIVVAILATSASALTNTNLVASAYYLRVDTNGVITGPANFKATNDIASASLTAPAVNLNIVSNMVTVIATNIASFSGSTGLVKRVGDSMSGDLLLRGGLLFTNYYFTTFDSLDKWALNGFSHISVPGLTFIYCSSTNATTASFTNNGVGMMTNTYRISWSGNSVDVPMTYHWKIISGGLTNELGGVYQSVSTAGDFSGSECFTGSWDSIYVLKDSATNATSILIDNFTLDQFGASLAVDADIIKADVSPWFRYATYTPASSSDIASNYTLSVVGTNLFLCLTTNSFGSGTNWIALQGRFF